MSVNLVSLVLRQRISSATEKLILVAFAEHTNEDGLSFPSVDLVAAEASCSKRTVQRVTQKLVKCGLLKLYAAAAGRGRPVTYRVCPEAIGRIPEYWELREAQRRLSDSAVYPADSVATGQSDMLVEAAMNNSVKGDTAMSPLAPEIDEKLSTKGDTTVSPLSDLFTDLKGDKSSLKGDKNAKRGDIAVSPEPRTINHRERSDDRKLSTGTPSGSPAVTPEPSQQSGSSSRSPPLSSRPPDRSSRRNHGDPGSAGATRYLSKPGEIEKPSLREMQKLAYYNALPPMGKSEDEGAFRSRINNAISQLTVLNNQCRALKIKGRHEGESLKNFDRRVNEAVLHAQGHTDYLSPDDARTQCRKSAGLRT